jgi:hypothetical protein
MAVTKTGYVAKTLTYSGQNEDSFNLQNANRFGGLNIELTGTADTTTGTLHPHAASILNMIESLEVVDNAARTYLKLSGAALKYIFSFQNGVEGENAALAGGAAVTGGALRQHVFLPFTLPEGVNEMDTLLQSMEKELTVKVNYINPADAGVLFGDITGLSVNSDISLHISTEQYRVRPGSSLLERTPMARSLIEKTVNVDSTNDEFKVELPIDREYRGVFLIGESYEDGRWNPSADVIDLSKLMSIESTRDNNVYRKDKARIFRNETIKEYGNASIVGGMIHCDFLPFDRMTGTLTSTNADELFIRIPAVKQSGNTRIRVVTDTITTQMGVK